MGRKGISYELVKNAIQKILDKNENPTVDRIREILGTGSKGTILGHFRSWRANQNQSSEKRQNLLPPELMDLINSYYVELKKENKSKQSLTEETQIAVLKNKLQILESNRVALIQERTALKVDLKRLVEELTIA